MREGLVVVVVVVVIVVNFIEREDFIIVVDPRDGESLSLLLPLSDGSSCDFLGVDILDPSVSLLVSALDPNLLLLLSDHCPPNL